MDTTKTEERQSLINKLNNFNVMLRSTGDVNASNFEAIANRVTEMLQNPVDFLSSDELYKAYEIQEHSFDIMDIENELEESEEHYVEKFGIDERPVTDEELERMAKEFRKTLDDSVEADWSTARYEAVTSVLKARPQILIGKPINGISINGLEYVLDDDGNVMKFTCVAKAKEYLEANGISEDEADEMGIVFEEEEQ